MRRPACLRLRKLVGFSDVADVLSRPCGLAGRTAVGARGHADRNPSVVQRRPVGLALVSELALAERSDLDVFATAVADGYVPLTEDAAGFALIAADHLTAERHDPGIADRAVVPVVTPSRRRGAHCSSALRDDRHLAVLFGLSMDYEDFLLSRIREALNGGRDTAGAVTEGLARTARVITAAATIMIVVFGALALSPEVFLKLIGVGLAAAVLIDATIVRMVLVPAVMQLLGDRNWWIPRWLDRLIPRAAMEAPATA